MTYHPEGLEGPEWTVDFTPPFRRLKMFPDLEKALGAKLPAPDQLHTEEARAALDALCLKHNVGNLIITPLDVFQNIDVLTTASRLINCIN